MLTRPLSSEPTRFENRLHFRFPARHEVLSWAIVGGGRRQASAVVWYQVKAGELRPPVEPKEFLEERLRQDEISDAVGLLTSRKIDAFVDCERRNGEHWVRCVATVGLSNALRAGDPPGDRGKIGTINLLCQISHPLTEEAFLETMAVAVEARTAAILNAGVPSSVTGELASGTGTDCVVIAAPISGVREKYIGKHTVLGHLIGAAVMEAVGRGADDWKCERERERES